VGGGGGGGGGGGVWGGGLQSYLITLYKVTYTHSVNVVCVESAMARWTIKILHILLYL